MWLVWWWELEKPSLLLDQSPPCGLLCQEQNACKAAGGEGETAEAFVRRVFRFLNRWASWTVSRVIQGCFQERKCFSEPGTAFFPLLTIFASPSPDFLGHGEHGWKQNVAPSVWMNVCGNQLRGRGSPHRRISHRVCSGLQKDSKLKPCLMVKIFQEFLSLSDVQGHWCSVVTHSLRERGVTSGWHKGQKNMCSYMSRDTQQTGSRWDFLM